MYWPINTFIRLKVFQNLWPLDQKTYIIVVQYILSTTDLSYNTSSEPLMFRTIHPQFHWFVVQYITSSVPLIWRTIYPTQLKRALGWDRVNQDFVSFAGIRLYTVIPAQWHETPNGFILWPFSIWVKHTLTKRYTISNQ